MAKKNKKSSRTKSYARSKKNLTSYRRTPRKRFDPLRKVEEAFASAPKKLREKIIKKVIPSVPNPYDAIPMRNAYLKSIRLYKRLICENRSDRKRSIFAQKSKGVGSGKNKKPVHNETSKVRC